MTDTAGFTLSLPSSTFELSNEKKRDGYSREERPDDDNHEEEDERWESVDILGEQTFAFQRNYC